MNAAEHALVAYLTEIKPKKIGFVEFRTDVPGCCADIHLDARYDLFASECIFDDCSDDQARIFLAAFLRGELSVSWSVSEQLSKLQGRRARQDGKKPLKRFCVSRSRGHPAEAGC